MVVVSVDVGRRQKLCSMQMVIVSENRQFAALKLFVST